MKQYDYDEINRMQERALERVQNMKLRAEKLTEPEARESAEEKGKRAKESFYNAVLGTPNPEHIRMPSNFPERGNKGFESFNSYFTPVNEEKQESTPAADSRKSLISELFADSDKSLLLCLLMLLKADGADEDILMSLLYIML